MSRLRQVLPEDIDRLCTLKGKVSLGSKVALWKGDITKLQFDAIVNAANKSLLGGGGVDGAIHAAAGEELLRECRALKGCDTGEAKITGGYNLFAKHVIHTVGPIGENPKLLSNCYKNSLDLMLQNNLKTIAFPCISTGIYGYPNEKAANVALETTKQWLQKHHASINLIVFCIFLNTDHKIYKKLASKYFPSSGLADEGASSEKKEGVSSGIIQPRKEEVAGEGAPNENFSPVSADASVSKVPSVLPPPTQLKSTLTDSTSTLTMNESEESGKERTEDKNSSSQDKEADSHDEIQRDGEGIANDQNLRSAQKISTEDQNEVDPTRKDEAVVTVEASKENPKSGERERELKSADSTGVEKDAEKEAVHDDIRLDIQEGGGKCPENEETNGSHGPQGVKRPHSRPSVTKSKKDKHAY